MRYGRLWRVAAGEGLLASDREAPGIDRLRSAKELQDYRFADDEDIVAVELKDGRLFTAYYWQVQEHDLPWPGGRKHIDGTFFELT